MSSVQICEICIAVEVDTILPCSHSFCKNCLSSYLIVNISDGQVFGLFCPKCDWKFTEEQISLLTSPDILNKYLKFTSIKEILKNKRVKLCPQPNCTGYDECTSENFHLTCKACRHEYCFWCSEAWHVGRCKKTEEKEFVKCKKQEKLKLCPRCKSYISKDGGCNRVTCSKCNFEFCWMCKSEMNWRHKKIKCFIGSRWNNLYWRTILLMIFFPISWFFMFFAVFWYKIVTYDISLSFRENTRKTSLVLAFLLSPVLTVVCIPFWLSFKLLTKVWDKMFWDIDDRSKKICFFPFILFGALVICVGLLLFFTLVPILIMVLPVFGIFAGVAKWIRNRDERANELSYINGN